MSQVRVTLKLATSLDGRIATADGESRWITSEAARHTVHRLRAEHDAVLVGSQTAIDDDPLLTVRLDDHDGPQPLRAVADARLRLSAASRLVQSASLEAPVCVLTSADALAMGGGEALSQREGVTVMPCANGPDGRGLDPQAMLGSLQKIAARADRPFRVFLEGGGVLAAAFLRAGLVGAVEWFRAPIVLGAEGRPAIGALALKRLDAAPRFERLDVAGVGPDIWERYILSSPVSLTRE